MAHKLKLQMLADLKTLTIGGVTNALDGTTLFDAALANY